MYSRRQALTSSHREHQSVSSPPTTPSNSAPSVLIVILNWNSHEETIAAVESVLKLDYPAFSIVIVDNGSTLDPTQSLAPILSERVQLIRSPENLGYTGG